MREAYLVAGDDGTWEGGLFALFPSEDGTEEEKRQDTFRLLNHPYLHSWKAIRSHTAVGNREVNGNGLRDSESIGCKRCNLDVSAKPRHEQEDGPRYEPRPHRERKVG